MKRSVLVTALAALVAVIASYTPARATATTVVVRPANLVPYTSPTGWYFWNDAADTPTGSPGQLVAGPATPPLGNGSVELGPLTTASGGTGSSMIATNAYSGTNLADITSLSYASYQPGPTLAISLQFDVKYRTTDTSYGGRLVFEPYQNGTVTVGSGWQTWSPLAGKWWATKTTTAGTGGAQVVALPAGNCAISSPCTWAAILAAFPNAQINTPAGVGRLALKSGSNWSGFDGNADALVVGISGDTTTYDFDVPTPCTTDCYVRPDGNDLNGGGANTPAEAKQTIQAAVNAVTTGGTVHIAAGTYTENVTVARTMTIAGAGQGVTIVEPAVSNPNACYGNATCGGNASNVFLVQANSVAIHDVTVDGNNPSLTSGFSSNGIDVDARNGILINQDVGGFNGLDVHNVTVQNIYLRGIFTYGGSGFNIHDNIVQNVQGDNDVSIGIFNRNGSGTFANNHVSFTPDAISANHSQGTQFLNNVITDSLNGIHTDNAGDSGGVADLIQGNSISNGVNGGQGSLWALAPYIPPVFNNNTISNVEIGLAVYGQGVAGSTVFTNNSFDGAARPASTGALVTSDELGFGSTNVAVTLTGNTIKGFTTGVAAVADAGHTSTVSATGNGIFGNGSGVTQTGAGSFTLPMTNNWWGTANGPANPANTFNVGSQGNSASASVSFVPWLNAAPPAGVPFAPVNTTSPVGQFSSIQAGINASNPGGTVNAAAGTFTENVVVSQQVTIAGAGASTVVIPAVSGPNPPSCGSLCAGTSSVILIKANNVTIHDLTVDGDNPTLTSGIVAGGADLDARNGIITDHTTGVYTNLSVHDVTAKNIYLRGIYASSGGTFNFTNNIVKNVQADPASIGMFNFGGSGVFQGNNVSDTNDGISSNWSTGVQFLNNFITNSGSGVHTDNSSGGDLIQGNTVTNSQPGGYGIWAFVPYVAPTIKNNTVTNVDVALGAFGSANPVTVVFQDNEVDGAGKANSVGAYISTTEFGFGSSNSTASLTGNTIKNFTDGVFVDSQTGFTASVSAQRNGIYGNGAGVDKTTGAGAGSYSINMTPNWWGTDTGPNHSLNPAGTGNSVVDGVIYSPWLGLSDASGSPGFQMASPMTWIAGPAVCGATCIQAAIDDASNGDTVKAKTGVFNEHVNVNKQITLTAGSLPIIDGGGTGDGITISVPNVTVSSFEVRNVTNGIVIASGANNATVSSNNIHNFTSAGVRGTSATGANVNTNTINGGHTGSCVGGYWGIQVQGVSGTIASNTVSGIGNGVTTGCQEGRAVEADGTGTVAISNNNITQYQKSGIIVRDAVVSTITGNTTTGEGPTSAIAQNGITVTSTGATTITGNHVGFNNYTPQSDIACGILYFPVGNPAANSATINGNDSTEDEVGICLTPGTATAVVGLKAQNNTITKHHQQAILVDTMTDVLVSGNNIDGQGGGTTASAGSGPDTDTRYYGIFAVDSTGNISNNTIKGITHGPSNGLQSGVGIRLSARSGNSANMTISGNSLSDIQKGAIVVLNPYGGSGVNAVVSGNTVVGNGPINYIAQNGIQISNGATAQVDANNVSGYDYTPSTYSAVGILIYGAGPVSVTNNNVHNNMEGLFVQSTDNATVTGNSFSATRDTAIFVYLSNSGTYTSNNMNGQSGSTGMYLYDASTNNVVSGNAFTLNDYGVYVDYSGPGAPTGNHFNLNCIVGNTVFGMATAGTVGTPVDATQNWWGTINGANPPGFGDKIDPPATIDASSFLTAPTGGCVAATDLDGDGIPNSSDNCPNDYNPTQLNTDALNYLSNKPGSDSLGDACDADIDGDGYTNAQEIALGKDPAQYCATMRADVNGDGTVNILDLAAAAGSYQQTVPPANARLSQNADGVINILDLSAMAGKYMQHVTSCP